SSNCTVFAWPLVLACMSAVQPLFDAELTSTPWFKMLRTAAVLPRAAAPSSRVVSETGVAPGAAALAAGCGWVAVGAVEPQPLPPHAASQKAGTSNKIAGRRTIADIVKLRMNSVLS